MGKTREAVKALFVTGYKPTQQDFADLIDVAGVQGSKGDKGDKGETGAAGVKGVDGKNGTNGANGVGVKSISVTVDTAGKITGGTWIGTDDKSNPITINS
ncbi:collagen-like protein [Bacillus cereus]|uniref:collagen-like protein n=1 Tax=Bacillus TaxID=1386 RepID=UPI00211210EE|nr:collagen-like protein [Bacillus mycoides]MCQ6527518.1 collagen-like protein [Bacillus mycoides]HDR3902828.1 collagen-like protein [Bacillus cereus]